MRRYGNGLVNKCVITYVNTRLIDRNDIFIQSICTMEKTMNKKTLEEDGVELDGGPGLQYMPYIVMDDLMDKLKLLNYEKGFLFDLKMKPLNRHYFALATNPGEQFHLFAALSAWLINQTGRSMDQPQEYDDPNSTISTILDHLRQLGVAIDFFPNKLKAGCGENIIFVLDKLADHALKHNNFSWMQPSYPSESTEEDPEIEDEAELTLEKVEDMIEFEDDEEDDQGFQLEELKDLTVINNDKKPENILHSTTTNEEWKLELERVLPQLKVTIKADVRDWRSHVEQMHEHREKINKTFTNTKRQLEMLYMEITRSLEKISSREKYLNVQLESVLGDYRNIQNTTAENREHYRQVSGNLVEKSHILAQISDDLDRIKQEMEERGSSMTDGTPLVNISKALARVKEEVVAMNVRIGVVEQKLLQSKLKSKSLLQKDMNTTYQKNTDLGLF